MKKINLIQKFQKFFKIKDYHKAGLIFLMLFFVAWQVLYFPVLTVFMILASLFMIPFFLNPDFGDFFAIPFLFFTLLVQMIATVYFFNLTGFVFRKYKLLKRIFFSVLFFASYVIAYLLGSFLLYFSPYIFFVFTFLLVLALVIWLFRDEGNFKFKKFLYHPAFIFFIFWNFIIIPFLAWVMIVFYDADIFDLIYLKPANILAGFLFFILLKDFWKDEFAKLKRILSLFLFIIIFPFLHISLVAILIYIWRKIFVLLI